MALDGSAQLAGYLRRKNLSQAEAARRVGVSEPYISQILSRKRRPSLSVATRIEDEFDIPARDFAQKEVA